MTTEDIADAFEITSKLMELHNENSFKVKAMASAAYRLSKTRIDLNNKSIEELTQIEGISKSLAEKIIDLHERNTTKELEELLSKTPQGVIEMLGIKGIGPKKVRQLWLELNLESVTELLYACHENRLLELKGFGEKTQQTIIQNIINHCFNNRFSQGKIGIYRIVVKRKTNGGNALNSPLDSSRHGTGINYTTR